MELSIQEPRRPTPILYRVDVLVAGGGLSGVIAAVSAARSGAKTALVERYASLGAVASMGLPLQGYRASDGSQVVQGLAEEFRQRLTEMGGATEFIPCDMHNPYVIVDPESVKRVCQELLVEAGVAVLLSAPAVDLILGENQQILAAIIEGKSGREAIVATQFIDCTGDADLVARSGGRFNMADLRALQAVTMNFQMAGVDIRAIQRILINEPSNNILFPLLSREQISTANRYIMVGLNEFVREAANSGKYRGLWGNACYITLVSEGIVCINSVHLGGLNPCDTTDLTSLEIRGREQAWKIADFMKTYIPGFSDSFIISTGPWIGIRESRIIQGLRTLNEDDVRLGKIPADSIGLGCYPIDFHSDMSGENTEIKANSNKEGLKFEKVPIYGIPYGCLVPKDTRNLIVAGRSISASRTAMSSSRVMATCMAVGEAAGVAAAMCVYESCSPSALDVNRLRERLLLQGVRLW